MVNEALNPPEGTKKKREQKIFKRLQKLNIFFEE